MSRLMVYRFLFLFLLAGGALITTPAVAKESGEKTEETEAYDAVGTVMEHIADANEFHVWYGVHIPLPCFLYAPEHGWTIISSSAKFDHGHKAIDGYVLNHGRVNRLVPEDGHALPEGELHIKEITHKLEHLENGKEKEVFYAVVEHDGHEQEFRLDPPSTWDGGLVGGGVTSFYDFSITKNVATMLLGAALLFIIFLAVARGYKKNDGKAPSGIQSFMEVFFTFIRDGVTRPMIGEKHYERFQPFIMSLFFFILILNLLGLVPFFPGGANVTGNIAITLTLAVFTLLITNLNGNWHYWQHILWMPGVPVLVRPLLTLIELASILVKPFSLMIRLFANISAGHIIILSLIGLMFVFGKNGTVLGGAVTGGIIGGLFTAFMNLIELLVAFLQAFVFAILAASYIGAAVADDHHHDEHEEAHAHAHA